MKVDCQKKFLDGLTKIESRITEYLFCAKMSTDLIEFSDFSGFDVGVFIGEFLEALFLNLNQLNSEYDIDDKTIEKNNKYVLELIKIIKTSFPINNDKKKAEIFEKMKKCRSSVSNLQFMCWRDELPKKYVTRTGTEPPEFIKKLLE